MGQNTPLQVIKILTGLVILMRFGAIWGFDVAVFELRRSVKMVGYRPARDWREIGARLARVWREFGASLARAWRELGASLARAWRELGARFMIRNMKSPYLYIGGQ